MNRQQRRAEQRRLRARAPRRYVWPSDDHGYMMVSDGSRIPIGLKADIARIAQSIDVTADSGSCIVRAGIGYFLLKVLGFDPEPKLGGLLFRAGPEEMRDVVAFCGPGNHGQMYNGIFLGHLWLAMDDEVIDFSCCEWKSMRGRVPNDGLGDVQWDRDPPEFIWAHEDLFRGWKEVGSPELGQIWYCPWHGEVPLDSLNTQLSLAARFDSIIAANIGRLKLTERVRALRAGDLDYAENAGRLKAGALGPTFNLTLG